MTSPLFTILMPVVRTPELMQFAIDSVLRQTRGDFELLIIGDGAPIETIAAAQRASAQDPRIRVFPFPKGERHGEAHRHTVLQQSQGRYICGLADDDLWFPNHLEQMAELLEQFAFGNLLNVQITAADAPFVALADLSHPPIRARMQSEVFNFFGLSGTGYRREVYRQLPIGWSPAPPGIPTDLAMWRKFLALPGLDAGTRFVITSLNFPAVHRAGFSMDQRHREIARYADLIATPRGRDQLIQHGLRALAREYTARHDYILSLLNYNEQLKERVARTC
jgi:glycosyltransferase involved in cell wall biosynthesis